MQRKRDRLQIIEDILAAIREKGGSIKPTHLLYKSNLSHSLLTSYLQELTSKELIRKEGQSGREVIMITDKGLELIDRIHQMREFEKTFGL